MADLLAAATTPPQGALWFGAGGEGFRSRWITCAADGTVLTRALARRVGSSPDATREGRGNSRSPNVRAFHQPSNVRGTVPKHNSSGGFAVAQEADGLTIREEQIRKVEHDNFAVRYYVERLT